MIDALPILLAEDDKSDVFLMQRAFEQAGIPNPLFVVHNGQEAVDYLAGAGAYDDRVKPHEFEELVVLLNDVRKRWLNGQRPADNSLPGSPNRESSPPPP